MVAAEVVDGLAVLAGLVGGVAQCLQLRRRRRVGPGVCLNDADYLPRPGETDRHATKRGRGESSPGASWAERLPSSSVLNS